MAFKLIDLPYDRDALEPYIDGRTVALHHDKHHAAYVNGLNAALEGHEELQKKSLIALLQDLDSVPEEIRPAGQTGHRAPTPQQGDLRAWLFLASPQLPVRPGEAEDQRGVLGSEASKEP